MFMLVFFHHSAKGNTIIVIHCLVPWMMKSILSGIYSQRKKFPPLWEKLFPLKEDPNLLRKEAKLKIKVLRSVQLPSLPYDSRYS